MAVTSARVTGRFGVVICGGGPAGTAPLIHAAHQGRLDPLLDAGVAIVERGPRLGGGAFTNYAINGNSVGAAFLECLKHPASHRLLHAARGLPATRELGRFRHATPPLSKVGDYLNEVGDLLEAELRQHPKCQALLGADVESIRLRHDGTLLTFARERGGTREHRLISDRVILALGGRPRRASLVDRPVGSAPSLERFADKVFPADAVLTRDAAVLGALGDRLRNGSRIAILGGSHGAWSTAWRLLRDPATRAAFGDGDIAIVHRRPIRLFYLTAQAARDAGYAFDPEHDVCPLSGRVNRFGGLRGDAMALALRVLADERSRREPRVVLVNGARARTPTPDLTGVLDKASALLCAFGYEANVVPIYDVDGRPLALRRECGALVVDGHAHVLEAGGRPLPNLLAYGLGAGLKVSPEVGGERSYRGRVDGVWLYQHDVGRLVMRSLLAGAHRPDPADVGAEPYA